MSNPVSQIAAMVRAAESHADTSAKDRLLATEYYNGKMTDLPSDEGRSKMTTRDVRAQIKKVLPSLMRTLLGSAQVVEFLPVSEGDEAGAQQSTDFMNSVVIDEARVYDTLEDAMHDALLLRNGIVKWWYEEKTRVSVSTHTGLTDEALGQLLTDTDGREDASEGQDDDGIEVLEHSQDDEDTDLGPVTTHSVKIRRKTKKGVYRTSAVPRERFLIHPDAVDLDDSPLVGEKQQLTRSDLVAMGYDRDLIYTLPIGADDDVEELARREDVGSHDDAAKANEMVDYYDLYVRFDKDDDGIAELRHMAFAGGLTEKHLVLDDECDEVQFADIKIMSRPHQWEGISLYDDLRDIQRGKTALLRQTLDNIYWQNNPQPIIQDGVILNPDAVMNPEFGLPIRVRAGIDVRAALGFNTVPFVAQHSFQMMEYLDQEAQDRTGVSDASAGLSPDALQNMTAKASAMIEQAGIGQTELMVKTASRGVRRFFQGLLRLIVRHQDVPRMVRLRDEWVSFDPRQWNAEMDCRVNTGLGAGTRERDMQVMQSVMVVQEKLIAGFGPDNPFVKPANVYAVIKKLCESAGLSSVDPYFTEPDEQEVQARLEAMKNQPNPEQMKIEAQMKIEEGKRQDAAQQAQMQVEVSERRESAQMQADLRVKQAEIAAERQKQTDKLASEATLQANQIAFDREKFSAEMAMRARESEQSRQDEIWKHQAAAMTGPNQP